jgi:hypothetical protein
VETPDSSPSPSPLTVSGTFSDGPFPLDEPSFADEKENMLNENGENTPPGHSDRVSVLFATPRDANTRDPHHDPPHRSPGTPHKGGPAGGCGRFKTLGADVSRRLVSLQVVARDSVYEENHGLRPALTTLFEWDQSVAQSMDTDEVGSLGLACRLGRFCSGSSWSGSIGHVSTCGALALMNIGLYCSSGIRASPTAWTRMRWVHLMAIAAYAVQELGLCGIQIALGLACRLGLVARALLSAGASGHHLVVYRPRLICFGRPSAPGLMTGLTLSPAWSSQESVDLEGMVYVPPSSNGHGLGGEGKEEMEVVDLGDHDSSEGAALEASVMLADRIMAQHLISDHPSLKRCGSTGRVRSGRGFPQNTSPICGVHKVIKGAFLLPCPSPLPPPSGLAVFLNLSPFRWCPGSTRRTQPWSDSGSTTNTHPPPRASWPARATGTSRGSPPRRSTAGRRVARSVTSASGARSCRR